MKVTVLLPVYNGEREVRQAIESILLQSYGDFDFFIIDDGSSDTSPDIISQYAAQDKRIKAIFHRHNVGLVRTLNEGLQQSEADLVVRMDQDDESLPERIATQRSFMIGNPGVAVAGSFVYYMGGRRTYDRVISLPTKAEEIRHDLHIKNCIYHPSVILRRREIVELGGYRAEFKNAEDYDLWLRVIRKYDVVNIDKPLLRYRLSINGMSVGKKWQQFYYFNLALIANRHPESSFEDIENLALQTVKTHDRKTYVKNSYLGTLAVLLSLHQWRDSLILLKNAFKETGIRGGINILSRIAGKCFRFLESRVTKAGRVLSCGKNRADSESRHILVALPFMVIGGADTLVLQIAKYLRNHRFHFTFLTSIPADKEFYGDNTSRYEEVSAEVYHLYNFLETEDEWEDFVYYLIETRDTDIIYIIGCAFLYHLLPKIKKKYPHIKIVDQLFDEFAHTQSNQAYFDLIDMTISDNHRVREFLVKKNYESYQKIRVIPVGIDHEEYDPAKGAGDEEIQKRAAAEGKFIVSYIGRFSREKSPDLFLEIVNAFKNHDGFYFIMVGNGPLYPEIMRKVEEWGIESKVYLPGFVHDIKPYLKVTDTLVFPSRIEGIPVALLAALSMGVPIVASDVGGIPSVIKDQHNGLICPKENMSEFIHKIEFLSKNAALREAMSRNARKYAIRHLSADQTNTDYHDTFAKLFSSPY